MTSPVSLSRISMVPSTRIFPSLCNVTEKIFDTLSLILLKLYAILALNVVSIVPSEFSFMSTLFALVQILVHPSIVVLCVLNNVPSIRIFPSDSILIDVIFQNLLVSPLNLSSREPSVLIFIRSVV
jgi:hypothetical protein